MVPWVLEAEEGRAVFLRAVHDLESELFISYLVVNAWKDKS